jgi:uncharacterized membrane protein YfhO
VSKSYVDFLLCSETGVPLTLPIQSFSNGLQTRPLLKALTGFKYQIAELDDIGPLGYERVAVMDNKVIYKNDGTMPLAFVYDKYMLKRDFDDSDLPDKDITLLSAVVTDKPCDNLKRYSPSLKIEKTVKPVFDDAELVGIAKGNEYPNGFECEAVGADPHIIMRCGNVDFSGQCLLVEFDITSTVNTATQIFWGTHRHQGDFADDPSISYPISANQKKRLQFFIVENEDISKLRIDPGIRQGNYKIENFEIQIYDLYDVYKRALDDRKKEPFVMTRFSQNHIGGTIDVAGDRMLFFSIPYSKGWKLRIDGEPVPIEKVNVGFIGAKIGAGKHAVELDYFLPGLLIGCIMSVSGCIIYIVMLMLGKKFSLS